MIRLFVVDDLAEVREMVRERLNLEPDMQVVGEASNAEKALELIPVLQPDVVLMDVKMPEINGIRATRTLCQLVPQSRVILLSIYDDPVTRAEAQQAGAVAFVAKQDSEQVLLATIRRAATPDPSTS